MKRLLLLTTSVLLLCGAAGAVTAQPLYYNKWYFGDSVGLDFSTPVPSPISGGLITLEGCASICNPVTGKTLFYTDGISVWNARDTLMKNGVGLFGHLSTTQSALIVPDPGDSLRYYLFTLDGLTPDPGGGFTGQGRGLNYSVIDMRGDSGRGEVVQLNVPLFQKASEKLVGVRHADGCGFWIITHELESNRFFAWRLSALGLSSPVISGIGPVYGDKDAGYLKASPDGTMLFAVRGLVRSAELFSFNPAAGTVDSMRMELRVDYGASFSPNNNFLYTTYYEAGAVLFQYDLRKGVDSIIKTPLDTMEGDAAFHAMQIGQDGRVYVCYRTNMDQMKLGIITAPNIPGIGCRYQPEYEYVLRQPAINYYGLPNCIDGFLGESHILNSVTSADLIKTDDTVICQGGRVQLQAGGGISHHWYPADSLSCDTCSDPVAAPIVTTTYFLFVPDDEGCLIKDSITITIADPIIPDAGRDTAICPGNSVQLTASGGDEYFWSPATGLNCVACPNPTARPAVTTTYTVTVTGKWGCTAKDKVTVTVDDPDIRINASGLSICRGDAVQLTASGGVSYKWSPQAGLDCADCPTVVARPTETTTYTVYGTTRGGCRDSASITIVVYDTPVITAGKDTTICPGGSAVLTAEGGNEYEWSPAEGLSCVDCPNPVVSPDTTTTYIVRGRKENVCSGVDSVTVFVSNLPPADAGNDTVICAGESFRLHASGGTAYRWSPPQWLDCDTCADPTATLPVTTTLHVWVANEYGCLSLDSVRITVQNSGSVIAAGDTAFCSGGAATLSAKGAERYRWSPVDGLSCADCSNPTATPDQTTTYYVLGTSAGGGCPAVDSVRVTVWSFPSVDAGEDRQLCADDREVRLNADGADSYRWEFSPDLSCLDCPDPIATPATTTTYYVTGFSAEGCPARDSVQVVVLPAAVITAGADHSVCLGDSVDLLATGGVEWEWSPAEGLSCTDCADPTASPQQTTSYIVRGWNTEGCFGEDTVTVVVREELEVIGLRIGRWYRGKIDSVIRIGVEVMDSIGVTDIREIDLVLEYNPELMKIDNSSLQRLLGEGLLAGWQIIVQENVAGRLEVHLTAPPGMTLAGRGVLLQLEGRMYLSDIRGTELPLTAVTPSSCFRFVTESGYAEVDSICGLSLRLFELTGQKYVPPTAYPNPGRERVVFEFGLGLDGPTQLEVFDAQGKRVGLIVSDYLPWGVYRVDWDVREVSSGFYWYRLTSGDWSGGGELRIEH